MTQAEIYQLIREVCDSLGIDGDLAVALAMEGSGGYALSSRYEPRWAWFYEPAVFAARLRTTEETERVHQATRWGVMMLPGVAAREIGFNDPLPALVHPDRNIRTACKHLKALCDRYEREEAVIAAFGAGTPRKVTPPQRFGGGRYLNQVFVDRVMAQLRRLRSREHE